LSKFKSGKAKASALLLDGSAVALRVRCSIIFQGSKVLIDVKAASWFDKSKEEAPQDGNCRAIEFEFQLMNAKKVRSAI